MASGDWHCHVKGDESASSYDKDASEDKDHVAGRPQGCSILTPNVYYILICSWSRWMSIYVAPRSSLKPLDLAWPDPGLPEFAIRLISTVISGVSASPPPPLPTRFMAPDGSL
ncbi:hypothetical protein Q3G72_016843 [Acer saccharum]|nr:hypothetical protein Q3G72_016843 [Acer saccharum]